METLICELPAQILRPRTRSSIPFYIAPWPSISRRIMHLLALRHATTASNLNKKNHDRNFSIHLLLPAVHGANSERCAQPRPSVCRHCRAWFRPAFRRPETGVTAAGNRRLHRQLRQSRRLLSHAIRAGSVDRRPFVKSSTGYRQFFDFARQPFHQTICNS